MEHIGVLKCDIKKFFDSVDHNILLKLLGTKIKDSDIIWLLKEIVGGFEIEKNKGIPIGNLTSQLFSNIYLNELDQFVKKELKVKYYVRYADDFIILHQNRKELIKFIEEIRYFLVAKLELNLHPRKVSLRKFSWGIDFVGYVALPYHQVVRTNTKKRIFRKVKEKVALYKAKEISQQSLNQSIQSYFGILTHANTYKLKENLTNNLFYWLNE